MNKVTNACSPAREQPARGRPGDGPGGQGEMELCAGLRTRLLEHMREARIPAGHPQALHLAALTGRKYQTTRRWIDPQAPGLPDLASFRLICAGMDGDPGWLLGLVREKRTLREAVAVAGGEAPASDPGDWVAEVEREVRHQMFGCRARRMRGDEMEPEIGDGDTMFVDFDVTEFRGNGNYLVSFDDQELVRTLEYRVGVGLVLSCANTRYAETIVKDAADSIRRKLRVLGRVEGIIQVRKFWRSSAQGDRKPGGA